MNTSKWTAPLLITVSAALTMGFASDSRQRWEDGRNAAVGAVIGWMKRAAVTRSAELPRMP
ncbi:hypothetical protein OU995_15465 [Roseateles sp. SL47]|uniref:hypothetical protein n=1 Tax=Roseateles sp. SL47 TaxID=2995138 RepID=UPI002270EE8B|nr:hypothetical protein [Roseateles sp. SL47]WAC71006.1 hypothetical protein OU995_15465 [Roseateles sp. SL47]